MNVIFSSCALILLSYQLNQYKRLFSFEFNYSNFYYVKEFIVNSQQLQRLLRILLNTKIKQ